MDWKSTAQRFIVAETGNNLGLGISRRWRWITSFNNQLVENRSTNVNSSLKFNRIPNAYV